MRYLYIGIIFAWTVFLFAAGIWGRAGPVAAASHDPKGWHTPGFGHEHGDAPPSELAALLAHPLVAAYWGPSVLYDGMFNTSAAENAAKHAGFKGYRLTGFKDRLGRGIDGYVVAHGFSNPMDRGASLHSSRVYIKDAAGGWTIRQGSINFGNPDKARVPVMCSRTGLASVKAPCAPYNAVQRPIMFVVDQDSFDGKYTSPIKTEQWYGDGAGFSWGIRFNATSRFTSGESASDTDPHEWHTSGMGQGHVRAIDLTASRPPDYLRGQALYLTQTGKYAAKGPSDPVCKPDDQCLPQYWSATYEGVSGAGADKTYPLPPDGVVLPN